MKLQSTVKQDNCGVFYYSSVRVALDMMEMASQDYLVLQNELKALGCYDYVVMDVEFPKNQSAYKFFENCNSIVFVTSENETSFAKVNKAIRSIQILDNQADYPMQARMSLVYNKSSASNHLQNDIRVLGAFPMYQSVSPSQMARQLSLSDVFDQLL